MLTFNSVLDFGRYKGYTVRQVIDIEDNPSYLIWMHNNVKHHALHPNTLRIVEIHLEVFMEYKIGEDALNTHGADINDWYSRNN